jgi:Mg-chelatase subunit ChlD
MTSSKKSPKNKKPNTTLLVLVVDRSGSMESIRTDMEGGITSLIADQKQGSGTCLVTLAQFDSDYEILHNAVPAAEFCDYRLIPRGTTALLDAIGRTIGEVDAQINDLPKHSRPGQVLFAVITDGLENASTEWSHDQVMAAVKSHVDAGWQFTFLGANQDAIQEGGRLGVVRDASLTYDATPDASRAAMESLSASVTRVRGAQAEQLLFTDDERRRSASG